MRSTSNLWRWLHFMAVALMLGGQRFGTVIGIAGLVLPLTLSRIFDLSLAWTLVAILGSLALILGIGSYRLWDEAERFAIRFWPTWEQLQDRADTLHEIYDANYKGQPWPEFLTQNYLGSHREAARSEFDMAETAGFPLPIEREALRRPGSPDEFLAIADAFAQAAQEWKEDERSR